MHCLIVLERVVAYVNCQANSDIITTTREGKVTVKLCEYECTCGFTEEVYEELFRKKYGSFRNTLNITFLQSKFKYKEMEIFTRKAEPCIRTQIPFTAYQSALVWDHTAPIDKNSGGEQQAMDANTNDSGPNTNDVIASESGPNASTNDSSGMNNSSSYSYDGSSGSSSNINMNSTFTKKSATAVLTPYSTPQRQILLNQLLLDQGSTTLLPVAPNGKQQAFMHFTICRLAEQTMRNFRQNMNESTLQQLLTFIGGNVSTGSALLVQRIAEADLNAALQGIKAAGACCVHRTSD